MNHKTMMSRGVATAACLLIVMTLAGCNALPQDTAEQGPVDQGPVEPAPPVAIGGSRDAHNCLTSAGYSWCERTAGCERSWELASERGFENSAEGYQAWCEAKDVDGEAVPAPEDEGRPG